MTPPFDCRRTSAIQWGAAWVSATPTRVLAFQPAATSDSSAKAPHEIDDQGNHKDQPERAAAKEGAAEVKPAAAENQQEHNQ